MLPEIALYKYFKVWGTFTIPTIYTNYLSFYEICMKLIPELNTLVANQNITSKNYDELVKWLDEQLKNLKLDMDKQKEEFLKLLDEFRTWLRASMNTFRVDFERDYQTKLQELRDTYKRYYDEFTNWWKSLKETYTNMLDDMINELDRKYASYNDLIDNRNSTIKKNLDNDIKNLNDKYIDLEGSITEFKTEWDRVINEEEIYWNQKYDELIELAHTMPQEILENMDYAPVVKKWYLGVKNQFHQESIFIDIDYIIEENDPFPQEPVYPFPKDKGGLWCLQHFVRTDGNTSFEYYQVYNTTGGNNQDGYLWYAKNSMNKIYRDKSGKLYLFDYYSTPESSRDITNATYLCRGEDNHLLFIEGNKVKDIDLRYGNTSVKEINTDINVDNLNYINEFNNDDKIINAKNKYFYIQEKDGEVYRYDKNFGNKTRVYGASSTQFDLISGMHPEGIMSCLVKYKPDNHYYAYTHYENEYTPQASGDYTRDLGVGQIVSLSNNDTAITIEDNKVYQHFLLEPNTQKRDRTSFCEILLQYRNGLMPNYHLFGDDIIIEQQVWLRGILGMSSISAYTLLPKSCKSDYNRLYGGSYDAISNIGYLSPLYDTTNKISYPIKDMGVNYPNIYANSFYKIEDNKIKFVNIIPSVRPIPYRYV